MTADLTFRRLTSDDLPLMHRWLNDPGVVRWWEGEDVSWEAVVADYGPDSGAPPDSTKDGYEHWIACESEQAIGWIRCGALADFGDDESAPWLAAGVEPTAAGIDYLIGESSVRGRGLGALMIDAFVTEVVFGLHPSWTQTAADPYDLNVGSWRALEKAGFELLEMLENPGDDDGPSRLMVRGRNRTS